MRASVIASALALAGAAIAQSNYPNQSAPFNLQFISEDDDTLNGTYLTPCHTGAAIESLCTYVSETKAEYYVNYTTSAVNYTENSGILTWNLVGSEFVESEPLVFTYSLGSNVALPLLEPSPDVVQITFDDKNLLAIANSIDDTVTPPKFLDTPELLYRWYVCTTYYSGYEYDTLAWVMGNGTPQNPSCKKVDVLRTFV